MKKGLLVFVAFALFFVTSIGVADARPRGGGLKSPRSSFSGTPSKPTDNVSKSSSSTSKTGAAAGTTTANRGFFSGGSFMKGLMIGGLAGMLFGGMFGNMGFLGNFFGLIINVLAIYILIVAIRGIFLYFRNRRNNPPQDNRRPF